MFIPDFDVFDELKPCPFCGQKPVVREAYQTIFIECTICDIVFYDMNNPEKGIESWQTRKYQENPFNFLYDFKNWFAYEVAIRNRDD